MVGCGGEEKRIFQSIFTFSHTYFSPLNIWEGRDITLRGMPHSNKKESDNRPKRSMKPCKNHLFSKSDLTDQCNT